MSIGPCGRYLDGLCLSLPIYKRGQQRCYLIMLCEEEMTSVISSVPRSLWMLRPRKPLSLSLPEAQPGRLCEGVGSGLWLGPCETLRSVRRTDLGTCLGTGGGGSWSGSGLWGRYGDLLLTGGFFTILTSLGLRERQRDTVTVFRRSNPQHQEATCLLPFTMTTAEG